MKYLAGFCKNHNTQHIFLEMIEIWHSVLNKGNKVVEIVMDPPKSFDTISHNLPLGKLKAYGFDTNALTFIKSYFCNRQKKTEVGDEFSKWQKISTETLQDSIRVPLLLNIFINDLFLFIETSTLCNYAEGNYMYFSVKDPNVVIRKPRQDFPIISVPHFEKALYSYSNFTLCSVFRFRYRNYFREAQHLFQSKSRTGNHLCLEE